MDTTYTVEHLEDNLSTIDWGGMDAHAETQLAAQIGQLLLERNKALEAANATHRSIISEQQTEIERLQRRAAALNESHSVSSHVSEQLEATIIELERCNRDLTVRCQLDGELLKEARLRRDLLEQRCATLQEYQHCMEDELAAMNRQQSQLRRLADEGGCKEDEHEQIEPIGFVDVNVVDVSDRIDALSGELVACKDEVSAYHERMDRLERQLAQLVRVNGDLEELVMSHRCESNRAEQEEQCASLFDELMVAKGMDSFVDGEFSASTPPNILVTSSAHSDSGDSSSISTNTGDSNTSSSTKSKGKKRLQSLFRVGRRKNSPINDATTATATVQHGEIYERRVTWNVSLELNSQHHHHHRMCRQRKMQCLLRAVYSAYRESMLKGLRKLVRPLIIESHGYFAALLLWSSRIRRTERAENNMRTM